MSLVSDLTCFSLKHFFVYLFIDLHEIAVLSSGSGETSTSETATPEEEELNLTFIIIPAVVGLVVIAIVSIVLGLFLRRWLNQKHRGEGMFSPTEITTEDRIFLCPL